MPRYVMKLEAVFDAKDDAQAAMLTKKLDDTLKSPSAKLYFRGQGITLIAHKVDPTPQKQG